jgi:hypothetical protein
MISYYSQPAQQLRSQAASTAPAVVTPYDHHIHPGESKFHRPLCHVYHFSARKGRRRTGHWRTMPAGVQYDKEYHERTSFPCCYLYARRHHDDDYDDYDDDDDDDASQIRNTNASSTCRALLPAAIYCLHLHPLYHNTGNSIPCLSAHLSLHAVRSLCVCHTFPPDIVAVQRIKLPFWAPGALESEPSA